MVPMDAAPALPHQSAERSEIDLHNPFLEDRSTPGGSLHKDFQASGPITPVQCRLDRPPNAARRTPPHTSACARPELALINNLCSGLGAGAVRGAETAEPRVGSLGEEVGDGTEPLLLQGNAM